MRSFQGKLRGSPVIVLCLILALVVGCGSEGGSGDGQAAAEPASECDPNYSGACLDPYASDYDCEGGSGDGPLYTGPVTVVGEDPHGLDDDGDGSACEWS